MVARFHCLHDDGMLEEEGGEYVDAEDYDNLKTRHTSFLADVRRVLDDLTGVNELQEGFTVDEAYDMDCTVTDAINGLTAAFTSETPPLEES